MFNYFIAMYWYYLVLVLFFGIMGIIYGVRKQQRQNLSKKAIRLGNIIKRPYADVVAVLGEPKFIDNAVNPKTDEPIKYVSWSSGGYTIQIEFDKNDLGVRVVRETVTSF